MVCAADGFHRGTAGLGQVPQALPGQWGADLGSLYGFMLYDFGDGMNGFSIERWGEIPILRPGEGKLLSAASDIGIYAGAASSETATSRHTDGSA